MIGGRFSKWPGSKKSQTTRQDRPGYIAIRAGRPQRYAWRSTTAYAQASRALRLVNKFRKEEEVKQIDLAGSATLAYTSTGTWTTAGRILLNPLQQGTTAETRIGRKITLKDVLIRMFITRHSSDTKGAFYRIVVFYDRKPAGAAPSATTIFDVDTILSPLNRGNAGRFSILFDETVEMDEQTDFKTRKIYIPLTRTPVTDYGLGNAGTIADISKGALYLWVNGEGLDTADSSYTYNSRVKYTDA